MAPGVQVDFVGQQVFNNKSLTGMMSKTRKVSKCVSNGFVRDYRHVVETTGESSSSRVDTEMTVSRDSCVSRRNSGNNVSVGESSKWFGVPFEVLSLSKLSRIERKELGKRLRHELELVKSLQSNIEQALSSLSDVNSHSVSQRKPVPEVDRIVPAPPYQGKKRGPPFKNRTGNGGPRSKKAALPPPVTGIPMLMKQCEMLLKKLMAHDFGWAFNTPVDAVAWNVPDYYTVIQHPMDLGTVKTKLNSGNYADPLAFASDVRLTFKNAMKYNPPGNRFHTMADKMNKFFEPKWKAIEKQISVATEMVVPVRQTVTETETITDMPPFKKKKTASFGNEIKQEPVKPSMSLSEKQKLSSELEDSLADLPESIIDFLKDNSSNGNTSMEDEIEIDIDSLSDDTLFKLRKLLDDFFADKQKKIEKAKTCEIERLNESGLSNSSMQACKVNDVNEEDIDIGGNDLPISSFPPVEIEKDAPVRTSKCSSSSSSSSDSGSSSDSDSDSSSGSELNGAKVSAVVNNIMDTLGSEANTEKVTSAPRDAEDSVNGATGQVEQKSQSIPVSADVDVRPEGESAPSERQVSPDKLYRAAMMRSRFADTILKAQEKTNGKVQEEDRERLRLEKEELEKRRKEEKARLQAEAKAAEEAKRKADLEAAAEVKRKRELEREAARQAIQKVEKNVDINDNSQFLEDLEMLSIAAVEPSQNSVDEDRADCCEDPLGSFTLKGIGNPLEQLGLYMKNDVEEDEEE
uniref:transcription factor GTE10-like n=1 Tax=Erigeron canadensis TaxID=72917 RepID=UPI001CB9682C|nr:transcription factor GTE10-like [Erigeron canadensis]